MRMLRLYIASIAVMALLGAGAVAASDESDPSEVELRAVGNYDTLVDPGTLEFGDVIHIIHQVEAGPIIESSDPRFSGTWTFTGNKYQYPAFWLWNGAFRVENDEGAWQGAPTIFLTGQVTRWPRPVTSVFTGERAYDGWTVVAEAIEDGTTEGWVFDGVIFEGQVPPPAAD